MLVSISKAEGLLRERFPKVTTVECGFSTVELLCVKEATRLASISTHMAKAPFSHKLTLGLNASQSTEW